MLRDRPELAACFEPIVAAFFELDRDEAGRTSVIAQEVVLGRVDPAERGLWRECWRQMGVVEAEQRAARLAQISKQAG